MWVTEHEHNILRKVYDKVKDFKNLDSVEIDLDLVFAIKDMETLLDYHTDIVEGQEEHLVL